MNEKKALHGIRILDLSRILAGPTCTQLLGDLGADVIKVERPNSGDDTRKWGPPYVKDESGMDTSESAYYLCTNRNKRSITIDITQEEGQQLVKQLLEKCDVLIENFKVGGLKKYGLDYVSLKTTFPELVYCSITGFGQNGPYAERGGYDYIIQGMGGIMSLTGEANGYPHKVGVAIADIMTGMYASTAILSALRYKDRTGKGQQLDLSLLDCQVAWLANCGTNYLASGEVPERLGNQHPNIVPYQVFPTSDGHIILAVGNDAQFNRFCEYADVPDLAKDSRFIGNPERVKNRTILVPLIEEIMSRKTTSEWLKGLEAVNVPCGPVNNLQQVFSDPQVQYRNMQVQMPHPIAGDNEINLIGNPIKMSESPVDYTRHPPMLGEHTHELLAELLDLNAEEIDTLKSNQVI